MNAWEKHVQLIREYKAYYGASATRSIYGRHGISETKPHSFTENDILKKHHQFVFDEETSEEPHTSSELIKDNWGQRLARRYYEQLFKEYAIPDLSRYKEKKIALRWRIEKEVIDGKGQFICAEQQCQNAQGLKSWEVNFAYKEHGITKHALVKVRLCNECTEKLHIIQNKKIRKEQDEKIPFHSNTQAVLPHATYETSVTQSLEASSEPSTSSAKLKDPWKERIKVDKSQEEDFEDYLADLLL